MGTVSRFTEKMLARFRAGTFERIAAVLQADEDRAEFVRLAVEREIEVRENV
jgi:hypothetical protein